MGKRKKEVKKKRNEHPVLPGQSAPFLGQKCIYVSNHFINHVHVHNILLTMYIWITNNVYLYYEVLLTTCIDYLRGEIKK